MADKELCSATNEDAAASISIQADHPEPHFTKLGCAMDVDFVTQNTNAFHGTTEVPNVTKPIHVLKDAVMDAVIDVEFVAQNTALHGIRDHVPNVTKPFNQILVEQDAPMDGEFFAQNTAFHGIRDVPNVTKPFDRRLHAALHKKDDVTFLTQNFNRNGNVRNVTKPFDQTLVVQDSSSLGLYQQLYSYATQGKIDSFKGTVERKLEADEVHDPNARVQLMSRLSPHNKNTFLHIAASSRHAKLAAEIIHLHKPLLFEKNFDGDTALHITAKAGDLYTTNTLLREARGVDNNDHDVFRLLTSMNNEINTPLHETLIHGHQSVAKCLIVAHPALPFNINKEEKSPLYLAAEEGFAEIVKLIQKKAFEQNTRVHVCGKSPLHGAILGRRNKELLEIISSMEETFENPKDEKGRTPLHSAASIGYLEGVRFLLGRRLSDSHQMDHGGNFPIHSATSKGHVKIVKELLRHCPDSKELKNSNAENILHVAARCGKDNLVKYFLKKGEFRMLINQKDSNGNTPLHLATTRHHPKVVYRLAWDKRANLQLLNDEGKTALDITESTLETIASYHGGLTWMVLKSAFAQRAQSLHVLQRKKLRSPQVADNGGGLTKLPNVESIRDRVNALLVVATLVATMAFAAGFTMPGGNNDSTPHEGMAILLTKAMFQAFVICNTIAMHTAILVAVCLIWAQLGDIYLVDTALHMALPLLGIALTMMSLAFTAGVYVVVSNLHWLAYVVLILGVLFIVTVLVVFIPLSCKTTSRSRILCYITYFFFCVEEWASRSPNNDQKED